MDKLKKTLKKFKEYRQQLNAYEYAFYVISWDSETIAPSGCMEERSKQVGVLASMQLKIERSKKYVDVVNELYENIDKLDEINACEIKKIHKELEKLLKIPSSLLIDYRILLSKALNIWSVAKNNNDYNLFAPVLKEIIDFNKKYIKYLETPALKGYDVLLDEYEEKMNQSKYDEFFSLLKREIVPIVKKINQNSHEIPSWAKQKFDINKQKEFSKYLMDVMCFDQEHGMMGESEHPFTSGYGTTDVRVTNHYYEELLLSSIFSSIHELGHATYEQQCSPALDNTVLSGGSTMAMHESQSRFYENIIGRSYTFWEVHYPKLQSIFKDELKNVTLEEFYKYVNYVECSLIRTEADELTYPLHIMVRYEIEKRIFSEDIDVYELPKIWNNLYKEYLGIDVPSDKEGILQDSHWSGGAFGYFPTYALGSAYASQLYHQMAKEILVDDIIKKGDLKEINEWLKEHVHKFGGLKNPQDILKDATSEEFNPKYYVDYLKHKYNNQ